MIYLTIRTDRPEAEIGLFDNTGKKIAYEHWLAHRQLSTTIHQKILDILAQHGKALTDVTAIIGFAGPGSFTGLRIGLTVANSLAYGLSLPIVATQGDNWIQQGINKLQTGESDKVALPEYGAPVHITQQKK